MVSVRVPSCRPTQRRIRHRAAQACLLTSLLSLGVPLARSQPDLTEASLEQLMNVQVTSVSKKEQKLARTAAAVFVITQQDIQRSGATNIPDLLRMVPGVQVARIDANAWAISIRGFNTRYSNKVLVLIDGRSVYSPSFSGVFWEQQGLPLEDIERIEVIRGPGATVWGANAVNGVINIITKSAKATQGGLLTAGAGNQDNASATLRYGSAVGKAGSYRVFGQYSRIADSPLPGGAKAADGWRRLNGGFRSDWDLTPQDSLTVEGSVFSNSEGQSRIPGFVNLPPSPQPVNDTITVRGADLLGRWNHILSGGSDMSLQMYVDEYRRVDLGAPETHRAFDLDFQHHVALGARHDIVWGLGYRATNSGLKSPDLSFVPSSRTDGLYSAFIQDEIRIADTLWLTVGTKVEHNPYSGFEYEPGVSLAWTPTKKRTIWLSAAKAIRQTSLLNADIDTTLSTIPLPNGPVQKLRLYGNPEFKSEQVRDYEMGYRAQLNKRISLDAALFVSFYRHLQTFDPASFPPFFNAPMQLVIPATYRNNAHATNYGAEMSTTWQVNSRWRLSPGYSYIQMRVERYPGSQDLFPAEPGGDAPKHMLQVRSEFNLAKNVDFDNSLYYSARLRSTGAPSRARFDSRIAWRAGESLEFSVVGQNLLRPRTLEFGDAFAVLGTEAERSFFGKISWRF